MRDIDAERAWLRHHGSRQRVEDEIAREQRDAEWRPVAEGGVCGVPPCAQCGSRDRIARAPGALSLERCAQCGTEWQISPIADH